MCIYTYTYTHIYIHIYIHMYIEIIVKGLPDRDVSCAVTCVAVRSPRWRRLCHRDLQLRWWLENKAAWTQRGGMGALGFAEAVANLII
jgi:hypothetical protein